jgi:hypothetical protein
MDEHYGEWSEKGATLSDKTAAREYGLTREEIYRAADAGELQYRMQAIHGNPFLRLLRLLRREVEAFVAKRHGGGELEERKRKAELAKVVREIRRLKREVEQLEIRKDELERPRPR